ncbi:hypothetical protein L0Y40_02225 [Candidatus Wolfebacteria bacterium]|nr:hypothetical protein [Candidatus Wolfebacteria bacterium]
MTVKQIIILIIVVILLGLVVWGGFVFVDRNSLVTDEFTAPTTTDRNLDGDDTRQEKLTITHEYSGGVHHYAGVVTVPTPCHALTTDATVAESFPEQIRIVLTTTAPAPDTVCIQVLDQESFEVTARASAGALLVGVTLDGISLPFEIFEEAKG